MEEYVDPSAIDLVKSIQNLLENNSLQGGIIQIGHENKVIVNTTETISNTYAENAKKLEIALKEIYKQLTLPQLSWLDEGMDLALNTFYMELQLDRDKRLISLEEIFNSSSSCDRLLIEAKPGYGKTTLCIKLLHDWARDAPYTVQFKLAFLIPLKNLPEEGILEGLFSIIPDCGIDQNDLSDIINEFGQLVLIVLDGFDELSKCKRQSVLRVVYRQNWCNATVILTSRCGEFYVQAEELEEIFGIGAFKKEFTNVKYNITGISESEVSKFVQNVSPHCDTDRLNRVAQMNPELFQCPLFVIMFTFLVSCSEQVEELNTKTKLYRALFNCVIKNNLIRDKKIVSKDFNIFDVNDKSSQCEQEILQEFGQLVFPNLAECKLQFDITPLILKVYKLGFLVKHQKMSLFKTTSHFEAFHKSILEFSVAYSIWRKCLMLNFNLNDEIIKSIVFIFMQHKNAQILPFFLGLCESKLFDLLKYLKSYVSVYWNVEEFLWELVSHNKLNSNLLKEFCNFMPFHCYAPSLSEEKLKLGLDSGQIKKVCIFTDDIIYLPKILIPELRLIVSNENEVRNQNFAHLKDIHCSNFILDFQFGNINPQLFQTCLQSFTVIQSKRNIIMNLNSEIFENLPTDFNVGGIKIDHVDCTLSGKNQKEFDQFNNFATSLNIESLIKCDIHENTFTNRNKLLDLIALLPITSEAVVVGRSGERVVFNFKDLTWQKRKKWYENLSKGVITLQSSFIKINYLNVNSTNRDLLSSILKVTTISILRCLSNHLFIAINTLPLSWPGFTDLTELSLILCDDLNPNLWDKIKKFQNIEKLELQMLCKLKSTDHIDGLTLCVLSLHVFNLSFHLEIKEDVAFIKGFFQKFKETACQKLFTLKSNMCVLNTVSIISVQNCDHLLVSDLLECLKLKLVLKLQFFISPKVWADIMRKTNIDYSIFQILFLSYGTKLDDEFCKLPTAFSRPPDSTKNSSSIQIKLKN